MRWGTLLVSAAFALSAEASLAQEKTPAATGPYRLPKVSKLKVLEPTKESEFSPHESCTKFVMSAKRARFFFQNAEYMSDESWLDTVKVSYCFSEGTVTFANGVHGEWVILRGNGGRVTLTDGPMEGRSIRLICRQCEKWNR